MTWPKSKLNQNNYLKNTKQGKYVLSRNLENIQCPLCKKKNVIAFDEIWDGNSIQFLVNNGEISEQGVIGDNGYPVRVIPTCGSCGHEWVLKGVKQINDIVAPRFSHPLNEDEY